MRVTGRDVQPASRPGAGGHLGDLPPNRRQRRWQQRRRDFATDIGDQTGRTDPGETRTESRASASSALFVTTVVCSVTAGRQISRAILGDVVEHGEASEQVRADADTAATFEQSPIQGTDRSGT